MTDHIEALERLQKLRETGAITDAEFEREKERLLRPPAARRPQPWIWITGGAAAVVLVALLVILLMRGESGSEGNESASANVVVAPAPATNAVAPAPVETGIRTRPEREQLAAAFRAAFGRDRRATRGVDGANLTYTPGGLRWIGDRAVLVSPGRSDQDCHACSGALAIHYLEPQGEGFRVTGQWLNGGGGASWGAPPDWRFSTLLTSEPLLESSAGGTWQGHTCTWTRFYAFAQGGPAEVVSMQMHQDNGGAVTEESGEQVTDISGQIRNVVKDRSFDVAYTGSERFTERYIRRGARYVLASGATRMSGC
jgi:Short C-terminal domain